MRNSAKEIASALGGGREQRLSESGWNTFCPAHEDVGRPSLTVSERGGKILLHCHAGCSQDAVLSALKNRGLWVSERTWVARPHAPSSAPSPTNLRHPKYGLPTRTWTYRDRQGRLVGAIYRFDVREEGKRPHKEILPVTWCVDDEGNVSWRFKAFVDPRPLYRCDQLERWRGPVLVVEGEKTADAAQRLVDQEMLVIAWPGGSKAIAKVDWSPLKGRDVVLWPDADKVGIQAMVRVSEILVEVEARPRLVDLPRELTDHVLPGEEVAGGWDLADDPPPGYDLDVMSVVRGSKVYSTSGDAVVDRFNREFAMLLIGGQAVVLQEERGDSDRVIPRYMSLSAFRDFFGNRQVPVGKVMVPESVHWIKHESRRSYTSVVFDPNRTPKNAYNLWQGFSVEPDPGGDWSMLEEHVRQNLARGDESLYNWTMGWFADIVQRPGKKTGTSLALRGKQGAGKTIIGKIMGRLYRPHYVLVEDQRYVTGNFNAHMASTLLLHADESFFAGDPRNLGKLKGLVTSDTHRIELKGKDSFEVDNFLRLLITTNSDFVVSAGFEERRFAVLDTGEGRLQDRKFFSAMWRQMEGGGFGGLLHALQNWDLSTVDVGAVPQTAALQDQKVHALDGVLRFVHERLFQGQILPRVNGAMSWPEHVPVEELYEAYLRRSQEWGERRRVDLPTFGKEIRAVWPGGRVERRRVKVDRVTDDGFRVQGEAWAYKLYNLETHRRAFFAASGVRVDGTEEDSQA